MSEVVTYINPITSEEFTDAEEYIDSIAESYRKVVVAKDAIIKDEEMLVSVMNDMIGLPEVNRGTVKGEGKTKKIKIKRKINVTYWKERGAQHPLWAILTKFPFLKPYIKIGTAPIDEKGTQITKFLERVANGEFEPGSDEAIAASALGQVRRVSPGKPEVVVADKDSADNDVDDDDESLD